MTDYYWAHFNDVSVSRLREILPDAKILSDGDCGSVWGEYHPEGVSCPFPHVVVKDPSEADVDAMKMNGLRFVLDLDFNWDEKVIDWRWLEDPKCPEREHFQKDYRKPYKAS